MCAPSMPPPLEPSSKLSRVTGQDACFAICTSFMPYFSNKPFSLAIISGAESVRAMNPNLAVVTSGASAGLMLAAGTADGEVLAAGLEALVELLEPDVQP